MAISGVKIGETLKTTLQNFNLKKEGQPIKPEYLLLKLSDNKKEIIVTDNGPERPQDDSDDKRRERFSALMTSMKKEEPCFILYDFHYTLLDRDVDTDKKVLIFWCLDEGAPGVGKMIYASIHKTLADLTQTSNSKFDFHEANDHSYESIIFDLQHKAH